MSAYTKFFFRPSPGEQVSTTVAPEPDGRSAICGRVVDKKGAAIADAMVFLFRSTEGEAPELCARFCTDEDGHFAFGPLEGKLLYIIKIFKNDIKIRELEVVAD